MKNTHLWMNRETGELLTYDEMIEQGRDWYDLDDDTNALDYGEYYEDTGDEVPPDWFDGGDDEPDDIEPDDIDGDAGFDPYEGCFTWDC